MSDPVFSFTLHATDGAARRGTVTTLHGEIRTPAFMPVGTAGTVKGLYLDQMKETGANIIGFKHTEGNYVVNPGPETVLTEDSSFILLGTRIQLQALRTYIASMR